MLSRRAVFTLGLARLVEGFDARAGRAGPRRRRPRGGRVPAPAGARAHGRAAMPRPAGRRVAARAVAAGEARTPLARPRRARRSTAALPFADEQFDVRRLGVRADVQLRRPRGDRRALPRRASGRQPSPSPPGPRSASSVACCDWRPRTIRSPPAIPRAAGLGSRGAPAPGARAPQRRRRASSARELTCRFETREQAVERLVGGARPARRRRPRQAELRAAVRGIVERARP